MSNILITIRIICARKSHDWLIDDLDNSMPTNTDILNVVKDQLNTVGPCHRRFKALPTSVRDVTVMVDDTDDNLIGQDRPGRDTLSSEREDMPRPKRGDLSGEWKY